MIQTEVPGREGLLALRGLQEEEEEEQEEGEGEQQENVYETIPPYSIPANFPGRPCCEMANFHVSCRCQGFRTMKEFLAWLVVTFGSRSGLEGSGKVKREYLLLRSTIL